MPFWKDKVVVVTGGSDGLGRELVHAFASRGSRVISLARNQEKNELAADEFQGSGKVIPLQADVLDADSVTSVVSQIRVEFQGINVWVNNVGASIRKRTNECVVEDYEKLMDLNFYSAVRCWTACREPLENSQGSLVNIGSLASKTAWPLVGPYSTSKHALAAFTHQLRLENKGVHFLHVCPGPIRRADSGTRYDDAAAELPKAARQPGAGAKVKGIEPGWLSAKIVDACQKRKKELVVPWAAKLLFAVTQLSPSWGDFLLSKQLKK